MNLTSQNRQEDLSKAYIFAVAAKAGCDCGLPGQHDVGEDLQITPIIRKENRLSKSGMPIYIQAKASYDFEIENDCIKYDLKVKNYNQLVDNDRCIPLILVLYCMPREQDEWLYICESNTILKHCGYWISLAGRSPSDNDSTERIRIPRNQIFNESSLKEILVKIQDGSPL